MKIVIKKSSTTKKMAVLASEALRARLFVPGWQLSSRLNEIKKLESSHKTIISIAYLNEVPIGVCVLQQWRTWRTPIVAIFIRKKYRRFGIGTKLIKRVVGAKTEFEYEKGALGFAEFFAQFPDAEFT